MTYSINNSTHPYQAYQNPYTSPYANRENNIPSIRHKYATNETNKSQKSIVDQLCHFVNHNPVTAILGTVSAVALSSYMLKSSPCKNEPSNGLANMIHHLILPVSILGFIGSVLQRVMREDPKELKKIHELLNTKPQKS